MKPLRSLLFLFLSFCLLLGGCSDPAGTPQNAKTDEIRAVWISYLDLSNPMENKSESAFRAMVKDMIGNICTGGMNTVFLQVRPFSDALYRSSLFPCSAVISGAEGIDPGFDALEIFCNLAQNAGLSVHAWINLFRIGSASKIEERADTNPAKCILRDDDPGNDGRVVDVNGTLYYNPADRENWELILDGVRELLQNYPVDGVHIDDYFYPTTEPRIDQKEYDAYIAQGGTEPRDTWRRTQINTLVSGIYTCVKLHGSEKIFSISPALQIDTNYSNLYADVQRWAAYGGYCDWLIPQAYVGFEHATHPFCETVSQWRALKRNENVRLLFGLAAYKCGAEDPYAGSARNEWIEHTDILSRQIRFLRNSDDHFGFALFSYAYVFGGKMSDNSKSEMNSVISML